MQKINRMKLQINTKAKTIKIDETVKITELVKILKKLLPKEWEDYSLETDSFITWYNPIPWYPYHPWRISDVVYCGTAIGTSNNCTGNVTNTTKEYPQTPTEGVYNIEVMN